MTTKSMLSTSGNPNQDNNNNNHDDGSSEKAPVRQKKTTTTTSSSSTLPTTTTVPPVCQICQEQSSRYTCPRCYIHTCSLQCCQQHKRDTSCHGRRRDTIMYVPLSQMNDTLLQSDYHFLQTATTTMDATRRLWNQMVSTTTTTNNNNNNNDPDDGPTSAGNRHRRPNPSHPKRHRPDPTGTQCGVSTPHALLGGAVSTTTTPTTISSTTVTESSPASLSLSSSLPPSSNDSRRFSHGRCIPLTLQTLSKYHHHSSNHNIQLLVLPEFMERHQRNQSHFVVLEEEEDGRPVLHWTMEICFVHDDNNDNDNDTTGGHSKTTTTKLDSSNDTIVVHSIPETISLPELLNHAITKRQSTKRRHSTLSSSLSSPSSLKNTASSILSSSSSDDDTDRTYQWYLKQIPCPANNPTYIHVATTTNHHTTTTPLLKDILRHQTILEFPTLYLMRTTTTLESDPNNNTA